MKAIVKEGKSITINGKSYCEGDLIAPSIWRRDGEKQVFFHVEKGYCDLVEESKKEEPVEKVVEPAKEEAEPKITLDEIKKMKRPELMNLCQAYKIKCSGVKNKDLIKALEKVI